MDSGSRSIPEQPERDSNHFSTGSHENLNTNNNNRHDENGNITTTLSTMYHSVMIPNDVSTTIAATPNPHSDQHRNHHHQLHDHDHDIFIMIQNFIWDWISTILTYLHPIHIIHYIQKLQNTNMNTNDRIRMYGILFGSTVMLMSPMGQSIIYNGSIFVLSILQRIIGTTIGIALGLGFATHVCNLLDHWEVRQYEQEQIQQQNRMMLMTTTMNDEYYDTTSIFSKDAHHHQRLLRRTNSMMMLPRRVRTSSSGSVRSTVAISSSLHLPPSATTSSTVSQSLLPPTTVHLPTIHQSIHESTASLASSVVGSSSNNKDRKSVV